MGFRIPTWVVVLGCSVLGLGMVAASLYLYIKAAEKRHWEGMRGDCGTLLRELRDRDARHPVLRGEPLPGNAWDEYVAAMKSIPSPYKTSPAYQFLSGDPKVDRSQAWEVVAQHLKAIDALRRGTSMSRFQPQLEWEKGTPGMYSFHVLVSLAACRARFFRDEGSMKDATELLLDSAQFGLDIARSGDSYHQAVGLGIVDVALTELRDVRVRPEDLASLFAELEILERRVPRAGDAEIISAMSLGFFFLDIQTIPAFLEKCGMTNRKISAWRYGGSQTLLFATSFEEILAAAQRRRAAAARPWTEAWALELEIHQELATSRNALTRLIEEDFNVRSWTKPGDSLRATRARLRLLRMAARYRLSGELLDLDDPFGAKLRSAPQGNGVKLWSVGPDGVDDGGTGEWRPGKGKDIVLTVER